ncbi:hypothetical protein GCM10010251_14450 [Streptomyces aurantiogriseus]|uniref:Uncharacterized protein n=1 Tax=Streptomyces aurantiogriseus TaxID=66870 RepID=A0A918C121_9ACTN|nr:hypothetical protein GCM10010251_14450 [Streptomyces aurantiogriseus]
MPPSGPVDDTFGFGPGPEGGVRTMSLEGGTPHNWGADTDAIACARADQPTSAPKATVRPRPTPHAPTPDTRRGAGHSPK